MLQALSGKKNLNKMKNKTGQVHVTDRTSLFSRQLQTQSEILFSKADDLALLLMYVLKNYSHNNHV